MQTQDSSLNLTKSSLESLVNKKTPYYPNNLGLTQQLSIFYGSALDNTILITTQLSVDIMMNNLATISILVGLIIGIILGFLCDLLLNQNDYQSKSEYKCILNATKLHYKDYINGLNQRLSKPYVCGNYKHCGSEIIETFNPPNDLIDFDLLNLINPITEKVALYNNCLKLLKDTLSQKRISIKGFLDKDLANISQLRPELILLLKNLDESYVELKKTTDKYYYIINSP